MLLKLIVFIWPLILAPKALCQNESTIAFNIELRYPIFVQAPRINPSKDNSLSLFGSSLLVTSSQNKQNLFIGASNLVSIRDSSLFSGGLFKCEIELIFGENVQCTEIVVPNASNHSLVGFNIGHSTIQNQLITCAPNWANKFEIDPQIRGMCFLLDRDTGIINSNITLEKPGYRDLFGFSLPYNLHSRLTITGIPGWELFAGSISSFAYPGIQHIINVIRGEKVDNNYLGYAIEVLSLPNYPNVIAISSPNYKKFFGKVDLYLYFQEKMFELLSNEAGEYFGATLLAVHSPNNSNKKDSLLVGAPMFSTSNQREIGRVYYYKHLNPSLKSSLVAIIISPKNSKICGRFGTTMASIDLNKDGYFDVIISSPFENNNNGAIYIYYGTNDGLDLNFERRIGSEDILKSKFPTQGFGYSLWTQSDLDNNGYDDLVVGSILTNNITILRSIPIAALDLKVNFDRKSINLTDTRSCSSNNACFWVNFCIFINLQEDLAANSTFLINFFVTDRKLRVKEIRGIVDMSSQMVISRNQKMLCSSGALKPFYVEIKKEKELFDLVTPIEIMLNVSLVKPSETKFCPLCPIANPIVVYKEIEFVHGCAQKKCISNLKLNVNLKYGPNLIQSNKTIVQGYFDQIEMLITVNNSAESSIDTFLLIKLEPFSLALKSQDESRCKFHSELSKMFKCEVNKLLKMNQTEQFKIQLNISSSEFNVTNFNFTFEVVSNSALDPNSVTKISKTIKIIKEAQFELIGNKVDMQKFSEQTSKVRIRIQLLVDKKGPSLVNSAYLQFYLPNKIVDYDQASRFKCNKVNSISSDFFDIINETLHLLCNNQTCSKYECLLSKLSPGHTSTHLELGLIFDPLQIETQIQHVKFHFFAQVFHSDRLVLNPNSPFDTFSTVVTFEREVNLLTELQFKYKNLMFFGGAGLGLLILVTTVIVLIKKGFFRRIKREELQQMKRKLSERNSVVVLDKGRIELENQNVEELN